MKKTTRIAFTSWLILSGIAGSPTPCLADSAVMLKADVELSRTTVRLSDLFAGVPAEIDRDIAQAPPACSPALYDASVLKKLATTYRLDWQPKGDSDQVSVSSPCSRISVDAIREALVKRMEKDSSDKKLHFEITFDKRVADVEIPSDDDHFSLSTFSVDSNSKRFRAELKFDTGHGSYVYPVSGYVSVKRNIPVLARRLEGGTVIGTADLDWLEMAEERITAEIVTEPDQLIGREIRRDKAEGEFIRAREIMPQRLVQRGSLVTMKIETPYILVTAQGKAQQDGAMGETIRVMNTQSNRIVEGVVSAAGVVEIRMVQKMASAE